MIIVMKRGHAPQELDAVNARVTELGYSAHIIRGVERVVVACVGHEDKSHLELVESMNGVEQAFPILQPFKLVSTESRGEPTIIDIGGVKIGEGWLTVMAGPCSVESEEQIVATARAVHARGAHFLRGGAYKPRTSPYAFQGLQEEGLRMLDVARQETGLKIVTEVVSVRDVERVAEVADVLQIGARNSQNYALLSEVGRSGRPVLLKRGMSTLIHEFLLAAEYIMKEGNFDVILCERGIRTFEQATRFTLDLNAVPVIRRFSHLPVMVDPAHGTGDRRYVLPMARAALAAGADSLMVEVHPDPANAASDGQQSLTFGEFGELMQGILPIAQAMGMNLQDPPSPATATAERNRR
jgi:3-deoxy-7-phosphoheptulonate synthase